ncbi:MAG: gluconate 2-dehydrogenase subunit 3 family protein [Blastocatellales bacterium]|nr:gluconate 2-dehydrogenase subunit 3 family protein [Blastocatellales bacterium]
MSGRSKEKTESKPKPVDHSRNAVTRREMLKRGAGAAAGAPILASGIAAQTPRRRRAASRPSRALKFFTEAEFALVDELSEMIIPTDDHSPGAREAAVAAYIDARLAEAFESGPRNEWRAGLRLVDQLAREASGKTFLRASVEERRRVLSRMAQNEADPQRPEEKFFRELKSRVADAYYTSKIGLLDEMEYKGNTFLREFAGEDAG